MKFEHPNAFALLLFAAPVILVYILRMRRKSMEVSALFLWREVLKETRSFSVAIRMTRYLSLLINLVVIALIGFAAAGPIPDEKDELIIVLDNSPSMGMKEDGGTTRLELAKRKAEAMVDGMTRFQSASLLTCAGVAIGMTDDREKLLNAIRAIEIDYRYNSPWTTAEAFAPSAGKKLVLISDFNTAHAIPRGATCLAVGTATSNIGIIDAELVGTGKEKGIRYVVRGNGRATLSVELNSKSVADIPLNPEVGKNYEGRLPLTEAGLTEEEIEAGGVIVLRLEEAGALDDDNGAYLLLPDERPARIALFYGGSPNAFLVEGLKLLGKEGEIDYRRSWIVSAARQVEVAPRLPADVVRIYDRSFPSEKIQEGGVLIFHSQPGALPIKSGKFLKTPPDIWWNEKSPLTYQASPDALSIKEAAVIETESGAEPVISSGNSAIAVSGVKGGLRYIYVGFPLDESDFVLRPSFPLFLRNAVRWLKGEEKRAKKMFRLGRGAPGAPKRAGVYAIDGGSSAERYVVNFFNAEESDVAPRREGLSAANGSLIEGKTDFGYDRAAIAAAFFLLLAEWFLHRRGLI